MQKFQLKNVFYENNLVPLSQECEYIDNIFTFIVGENSVGKSRLLRQVVSSFLFDKEDRYEYIKTESNSDDSPSSIVAVSTGRRDKFPKSTGRREFESRMVDYVYVGNEISSSDYQSIGKGCLSIAKRSRFGEINKEGVLKIFNYLGFLPMVTITLRIPRALKREINLKESHSIEQKLKKTIQQSLLEDLSNDREANEFEGIIKYAKTTSADNKNLDRNNIIKSYTILRKKFKSLSSFSIDYNFETEENWFDGELIDAVFCLVDVGLLSISDVLFRRETTKDRFRFSQASSGQQNIFLMVFGIAGVIKNGSMICIDEPEISLHPQWQLEIISNLKELFDVYTGCHFLIATHSPQVVSGAPRKNSFVYNMNTKEFYAAEDYSKKSSDYQLAEIFDSPGNSNEYLVRLLLVMLSKISNDQELNSGEKEQVKNISNMIEKGLISKDDPVSHLTKQLTVMSGLQ